MRPSIRFEIFKRDSFTCAYCGRKPPDVTLEVDHIIPSSEGGDDGVENLTTSCWDCNRGKGAVMLNVMPDALPDLQERAELIRERERQLRVYHEAKAEEVGRREEQFTHVWMYWFNIWGAERLDKWHVPWESTLRSYLDKLGPHEVMEAMDIARGRFPHVTTNAVRYFVGVLKRKVAETEGRVKLCTRCGQRIVLEPGQDINSDWAHTKCLEAPVG